MFQSLSRLRLRHTKQSDTPPVPHRLHGNVYCAALNIHRVSNSAMSAEDADRLFAALANIEDLARALDSSPADRADIVQWRQHLEAKAAELRAQTGHHEPLPHPQLQIDSVMLEEQMRRREAV
jgi:HPt (histidine-containing phosphotransfer) domain-containing protein